MNALELKNISKKYGNNTIFDNYNLEVKKGTFLGIKGKSGRGKTTLLNIMGLLEDYEGTLNIMGEEVRYRDKKKRKEMLKKVIGYLFQNYALIDDLTVYENICLPSYLDHKDPDEDFIQTVMEKLGIYEKKGKYAAELSGGEQQRVAVARALSLKPSILLADEPSGNLDKKNGEQLLELMLLSQRYFDQTILLVTHDLEIARLSQRMIVLEDGKIISDTALEGEKS